MSGEQSQEWEVHASGRTNLSDKRIPVYYNAGGNPYFIMHSTRYEFPLTYDQKDDGSVYYVGDGKNYTQEWYDARFYDTSSLPRSIVALYHKNAAGRVLLRDGYLIVPDHPLDRSLQPAVAAAAYAEAQDAPPTDNTAHENITLTNSFPNMSAGEIYKYYKQGLAKGILTTEDMISYIERASNNTRSVPGNNTANTPPDDEPMTIPVASPDTPTPPPVVSASGQLLLPAPQERPETRPIIPNISSAVVGPYHFNKTANKITHSMAIYDARRSQLMSGLRLAPVEEPDYSDDESSPVSKTQQASQPPIGQIVGLYL